MAADQISETGTSSQGSGDRQMFMYKSDQVIWLLTGLLEGMLGLRFVLKLMAANPENPFAGLVYGFTDLFMAPFLTLTARPEAGGMVLEIPTLIAMAIYALAAWALVRALRVFLTRPGDERESIDPS